MRRGLGFFPANLAGSAYARELVRRYPEEFAPITMCSDIDGAAATVHRELPLVGCSSGRITPIDRAPTGCSCFSVRYTHCHSLSGAIPLQDGTEFLNVPLDRLNEASKVRVRMSQR